MCKILQKNIRHQRVNNVDLLQQIHKRQDIQIHLQLIEGCDEEEKEGKERFHSRIEWVCRRYCHCIVAGLSRQFKYF